MVFLGLTTIKSRVHDKFTLFVESLFRHMGVLKLRDILFFGLGAFLMESICYSSCQLAIVQSHFMFLSLVSPHLHWLLVFSTFTIIYPESDLVIPIQTSYMIPLTPILHCSAGHLPIQLQLTRKERKTISHPICVLD